MIALYSFNLEPWKHYPEAERLLGKYVAETSGGTYSQKFRRVFHNRKISAINQEKIKAYSQALNDGNVGHP